MDDWSDTFRDRYYGSGYVYIAGSLSHRVLKIGTTVNIRQQERRLRRTAYGSIDDWVLLYYVWVDEGGRVEHDARRRLKRYRQLRMYNKEGHRQKGREIVNCRFGIAVEALTEFLDDAQRASATTSWRSSDYEFGWTPPPPDPLPYVPPVGIPPSIHLLRDIDQLELSVRTYNCLNNEGIRYVGEFAQKGEAELLRTSNFGRKSLNELKEILAQVGLHLVLDVCSSDLSGRQTSRTHRRIGVVCQIGKLPKERWDQLCRRTGAEIRSRDAQNAKFRAEGAQ